MVFFFNLLLLQMCWNTYFYSAFEHQPKLGKKGHKKPITFHSHFAKHRLIKKNVLLQPPFHKNISFFKFVLKPKTFMLKKKQDKEKGFERKNKTGNHKTEKILMKKNCNFKCSCCSFQKQKQRRKTKEKETKTRNKKKAKEKDKKEERKTRARERQRKRNRKKGEVKKGRGRKKEKHSKINKKMPFLGGKTGFFY